VEILGFDGWIKPRNEIWNPLEISYKRVFPQAGFVRLAEGGAWPFIHNDRIRDFAEWAVRLYDDGEPKLLVGHSGGGIVACVIAACFFRSEILGIVTIHSPHTYPGISSVLPYTYGMPRAPILSFGGQYDWKVPHWFTKHPLSVEHILLPTDHWRMVVQQPMYADRIARETKRVLFPGT
jgi:hypothetical protein